jgi:hypothetical protein
MAIQKLSGMTMVYGEFKMDKGSPRRRPRSKYDTAYPALD